MEEKLKNITSTIAAFLLFLYIALVPLLIIKTFPVFIFFIILLGLFPIFSKKYFSYVKEKMENFINNKIEIFTFVVFTIIFALPDLTAKQIITLTQQLLVSTILIFGIFTALLYKKIKMKILEYRKKSPFPQDYYLKNIEVPEWLSYLDTIFYYSISMVVFISCILDLYAIISLALDVSSILRA
ncbi:MAG: hypothetical protein QW802_02115 [Candidatus Altiarchaeota archaeon]